MTTSTPHRGTGRDTRRDTGRDTHRDGDSADDTAGEGSADTRAADADGAAATSAATGGSAATERPRERRRRRAVLALIVAGVVVLAAVLTWIVAFSSLLGVRTVQVHGEHLLSESQVRAASAIVTGTPLVRLDTADITRHVEKLPIVESAQVSTSFPSTVSITIVERRPVGYVHTSGGDVLVDRFGVHFRTVSDAPRDLPRLVLPSGALLARTADAEATVAGSLTREVRMSVQSIQALDPTSITLVLNSGQIVRWGGAERSTDKARILPALVKKHVARIDVTDPDQPFTH